MTEGIAPSDNVVGRPIVPMVVKTLRLDIMPLLEKLIVIEDGGQGLGKVGPARSCSPATSSKAL